MNSTNNNAVISQYSTSNTPFNTIYFDAFAPEKQPEMWSQELFNRLYVLLDRDGILTTYCAKRCSTPNVADSRIHSRTPPRTSGW